MSPPLFRLLAASLPALVAGCNHNVQLPPSRLPALEAPRVVGAGQRRLRTQLGRYGALFNGAATAGDVRLRSGLSDRLELAVDGSMLYIDDGGLGGSVYLGRLGLKLDPSGSGELALNGGVGTGFSAEGGLMTSADAGVTLGVPNPYAVPFLGLSTFVSAPVFAYPVRTGDAPEDVDTPTLTTGGGLSLGVSIIRRRYSIAAGFSATSMRDEDDTEVYYGLGGALELALE